MGNVELLKENKAPSGYNYSKYVGVGETLLDQQDVWRAGLTVHGEWRMDSFFVSKMSAGIGEGRLGPGLFGPELSFGERIQELTGARIMVIKFGRGSTDVRQHWNPEDADNALGYSADDGFAGFLYATGNVPANMSTNVGLFKTHTYLVRRTLEA